MSTPPLVPARPGRPQVVCQSTFFGWRVRLQHGSLMIGLKDDGGPVYGWWRPTLHSARRKGERELQRYVRINRGKLAR